MNRKMLNKLVVILASILLIGGVIFSQYSHRGWEKYYQNKLYLPPATLTQKAASLFSHPGTAIDFGCGCGNDAAYLLNNGWRVWAIDGEPVAIDILQKRNDLPEQCCLFADSSKFEEIKWDNLPKVELFLAIKSLPFTNKNNFNKVWFHIVQTIQPQGRFAGHFFGPNYQGFSNEERQSMTFLSKDEVIDLFQDFTIEFFEEIEEDGKSGTGREIHSHIFEVIAKKR